MSSSRNASTNPTLLFLHGAWHLASCWDLLRAELKQNFDTEVIQLGSVGDNADTTHYDDAKQIGSFLDRLFLQDKDVVVITHSYSAIPVGDALEGASKRHRLSQGKDGGVMAVVHLTSWTVGKNQSLASYIGGDDKMDPAVLVDRKTGLMDLDMSRVHWWFYADLDESLSKEVQGKLKQHSLASFHSELKYDPYSDMPHTYVRCSQDNAILPFLQDMLIDSAGGREKIKVIEVDSSHSPMLSMPKKCAEVIVNAVEEANAGS